MRVEAWSCVWRAVRAVVQRRTGEIYKGHREKGDGVKWAWRLLGYEITAVWVGGSNVRTVVGRRCYDVATLQMGGRDCHIARSLERDGSSL